MPDVMEDVVEELVDELTGSSSKKWALMLLALLVGAAIALWVVRRRTGSTLAEDLALPAEAPSMSQPVGS